MHQSALFGQADTFLASHHDVPLPDREDGVDQSVTPADMILHREFLRLTRRSRNLLQGRRIDAVRSHQPLSGVGKTAL